MKQEILNLLTEILPTIDWESDFLFDQLDSYGVITILMTLSQKYRVTFGMIDATPKNLMSIDAIVRMVEGKVNTH